MATKYTPVRHEYKSDDYKDEPLDGEYVLPQPQGRFANQRPSSRRKLPLYKRLLLYVATIILLTTTVEMVRNRQQIMDWQTGHSVPYKPGQLKYTFTFNEQSDSNDFVFAQSLEYHHNNPISGQQIQVRGDVIVKTADSAEAQSINVDLQVELSHEALKDVIFIKNSTHSVDFKTDAVLADQSISRPWIKVVATISVHPDVKNSRFDISTVQLPVDLRDSLKLAANDLHIKTVSGNVDSRSQNLDSRVVEITTTSGSISGTYPLADILSVKSISGTVNLDVEPKEADSAKLDPKFTVDTRSGSIRVETATTHMPDRDYITTITTTSGTVDGTYLLGSDTRFNGGSGSLHLDLHSAGKIASRSLEVRSMSGTIDVEVYDRYFDVGALSSEVHSMSGTVDTRVPASWSGAFTLESMSGSLQATGKGVKIDRQTGFVRKTLEGSRGDGDSNLHVKTMSGSVRADFA